MSPKALATIAQLGISTISLEESVKSGMKLVSKTDEISALPDCLGPAIGYLRLHGVAVGRICCTFFSFIAKVRKSCYQLGMFVSFRLDQCICGTRGL